MTMTGSFSTFSFPALMVMLGADKKSGILRCQQNEMQIWVYIRQGQLFSLRSIPNQKTISDLLIERQLLTPEHLQQALASQRKGTKLGQILIRTGFANRKQVYTALQAQMEAAFIDVLQWNHGEFQFDESELLEDKDSLLPLSEVSRKFLHEGLSDTRRLLNVFRVIADLDFFPVLKVDISLSDLMNRVSLEEYFLLALVNSRRTIRTILEIIGANLLDSCERLVNLQELDLITFSRAGGAADENAVQQELNFVLTALVFTLKDHLQKEMRYHENIVRNLETIAPGIGKQQPLQDLFAKAGEKVIPINEEEIGPELDSMFMMPDAALETAAALDATEELETEETPLEAEPVAVSQDDLFPWFEAAGEQQPVTAAPENEPQAAEPYSGSDSPVTEALESVEAAYEEFAAPTSATGPAAGESSGGDDVEEFMEETVAKRVRYQRFKSDVKMAYNRITMRKLNHFELFELLPNAPGKDVERAYLRLKKKYTPEGVLLQRDKDYFDKSYFVLNKLKEAYEVLHDTDKRHEYSNKLKLARKAIGEKKSKALQLFHEGMVFYKDGDYVKARESFHQALSYDSNNPVYYNMLETLDNQERQKESVKYFQAGKLTFEKKGDAQRAILLIRKAISIEPRAQYFLRLGEILALDKTKRDDAVAAFEEALKSDPGNADLHIQIGKLKLQRGNASEKEDALYHFCEALKWDEKNIEAQKLKKELESSGVKLQSHQAKEAKSREA